MAKTTPKATTATEPTTPTAPAVNFRVRAELLPMVDCWRAKSDIRYYLNGVYIGPRALGGVYLAATDGRRIAVAVDETGHADAAYIIDTSRNLVRACEHKNAGVLEMHDGALWVSQSGRDLDTQPLPGFDITNLHVERATVIDGKFPDFMHIIIGAFRAPDGVADGVDGANPELCQAFKLKSRRHGFVTKPRGMCTVVLNDAHPEWIGVVMNMRKFAHLPGWLADDDKSAIAAEDAAKSGAEAQTA